MVVRARGSRPDRSAAAGAAAKVSGLKTCLWSGSVTRRPRLYRTACSGCRLDCCLERHARAVRGYLPRAACGIRLLPSGAAAFVRPVTPAAARHGASCVSGFIMFWLREGAADERHGRMTKSVFPSILLLKKPCPTDFNFVWIGRRGAGTRPSFSHDRFMVRPFDFVRQLGGVGVGFAVQPGNFESICRRAEADVLMAITARPNGSE